MLLRQRLCFELDAWRIGGRELGQRNRGSVGAICGPHSTGPTQDLRRSLAGVRALPGPVESCFSLLSDLSALSSVQPEHLAINAEQVPVGLR